MLDFNLGVSRKKYTHNKSFHVDTTADFGSFQPILCDYLSVGDTANMRSFRQLVRNAVMPSPTFGDIKCVNKFSFVPVSDVFPAFEAMLSRQSIKTGQREFVPLSVPTISSTDLVALFMRKEFSTCVIYDVVSSATGGVAGKPSVTRSNMTLSRDRDAFSLYKSIIQLNLGSSSFSAAPLLATRLSSDFIAFDVLSPDSCDFRLCNFDDGKAGAASGSKFLGIRLNSLGRRLYNVFRGLGFSLDPLNDNKVSFLPVLAFYKAWFDNYFPTRDVNFQSTFCYKLIMNFYEFGVTYILKDNSSFYSTLSSLLISFFKDELAFCFYTYPDDFVSAHMDKPLSNVLSGSELSSSDIVPPSTSSGKLFNGISISASTFDYAGLQMLVRASKFLSKNSLIGARIHEYIKTHYGQDVYNSVFAVTHDVATLVTDIRLDDIYSTSDTLSSSSGQPLGSRAGVGSGFSDDSFSFKASTFGFLIGMTAVYPDSYFCQGDDCQLYMTSRFSFPSADFDALGYELTPLACIYDNHGRVYGSSSDKRRVLGAGESFGFIPRYSGLKTKRNLLNGDMARLSTADSFRGFYLDRLIFEQTDSFKPVSSTESGKGRSFDMSFKNGVVPLAGVSWKNILRYPQLGYFDRIFLNASNSLSGESFEKGFYAQKGFPSSDSDFYVIASDPHDNNFTIQCNCSYFVTNVLKPLSNSFDTFDVEVDNATTSVKNV